MNTQTLNSIIIGIALIISAVIFSKTISSYSENRSEDFANLAISIEKAGANARNSSITIPNKFAIEHRGIDNDYGIKIQVKEDGR